MENAPLFFKIILDDDIREGKIGMPKKFVKRHGNSLSSPITLKVPTGAIWQVELSMCDGEIWLGKGWKEFSEFHCLTYGSFLVFEYEGHCHFSVVIFDKSASEIEYPCRSVFSLDQKDGEEMLERDENEDVISVKSLDDLPPKRDIGETSPLPCHQSRKIMRTGSAKKSSNLSLFCTMPGNFSNRYTPSNGKKVDNLHSSSRKYKEKQKRSTVKKNAGRKRPSSCWRNSPAFEAANKFITNHPYFKSVVWLSTQKFAAVSIPQDFSRKYIEAGIKMTMTLEVAGRLWHVMLIRYSDWKVTRFTAGWTEFARDNSLEVGDVCIFELIKSDLFNVSIFRCPHQLSV